MSQNGVVQVLSAKPLSKPEFEALRRRVVKNKYALVGPRVVLRLIATVEFLDGVRRKDTCILGEEAEA